jgi:hypothetical protein
MLVIDFAVSLVNSFHLIQRIEDPKTSQYQTRMQNFDAYRNVRNAVAATVRVVGPSNEMDDDRQY